MGVHEKDSQGAVHRRLAATQRRVVTFLLAFSVVLIAFVILLSAVQSRGASCQERAHQAIFEQFIRPEATASDIATTVNNVLGALSSEWDTGAKDVTSKVKTIEILDTQDHIISSNGFRLLRRSDGPLYRYELRALFEHLCESYPTLSMEVLPNVDNERVSLHSKALTLANQTHKYMFESTLISGDPDRVSSFPQMQILFPGFRQVTSKASRINVEKSWQYRVVLSGPIYYKQEPLDINMVLQQWIDDKGKPAFWRLVTSSENIMTERDLISLTKKVHSAIVEAGFQCVGTQCDSAVDVYLR